jgi:cell division protein FtsB
VLFILVGVLFGVYCFVFGESGMLERMRLKKEKEAVTARMGGLKEENRLLREVWERYKTGELNREEALKLGYLDPGEKALFFRGDEGEKPAAKKAREGRADYPVDLSHLRILWIVISAVTVLFYYVRSNRRASI